MDCGDCWVWQGPTNGSGHPKVSLRDADGRSWVSARRVTYTAAKREIPAGRLITVNCGNPKCLNPDHLTLTTKADAARKGNANPATRIKRAASSARSNQLRFGKITMEIAREIRNSDKTGTEWAAELGCSVSLVSLVRRNKSWVEQGNPFAQLGARVGSSEARA